MVEQRRTEDCGLRAPKHRVAQERHRRPINEAYPVKLPTKLLSDSRQIRHTHGYRQRRGRLLSFPASHVLAQQRLRRQRCHGRHHQKGAPNRAAESSANFPSA